MSGGLRVPVTTGVGADEEREIHDRWNTLPWVHKALLDMGIVPPQEPNCECPKIEPGNLSTLGNDQYSLLYEKVLAWYGYVTERVAEAKVMVLQCENEMTYIEVTTKKRMFDQAKGGSEKRPTAEALLLAVETDARYIELKLLAQQYQQLRDLLQGRAETLDANLKTVSRHIEIRKLEQQGTRVGGNIPNRGREERAGFR
jgi:hypothetical protein